ncbi:putative Uncharacterized transporter YebQ [Candidatus Zixiibacteriota bacterium]|nr:putative Uncharacterized transporter YebQ [candidate division Zixibacteria bacterium]
MTDLTKYKYKALIITGLATFLGTLDSSIVNVSLPTISREMGASMDTVGWVIIAYAISIISLLMVFGVISEKKGYQKSYYYGFLLFILGSALCGLSFNIYFLIAMRALQGIGAALLVSVGPAMITKTFPESERGRGLASIAMVVATGLMLGPPLGGFIVGGLGWRWVFFVNLPLGLLGIYLTFRFIRDFPVADPDRKIHLPGAGSLSFGFLTLMLAFSFYGRHIITPAIIAAGLAVAGISFALFFYFEYNPQTRLIGLDLFKNKIFSFSLLALFMVFIGLSAVSVILPFYLEQIKKFEPEEVGLILMVIPICGFITAPLAGYLADKFQARIISTTGIVILLAGVWMVRFLDASSGLDSIIFSLAFIGLGMGVFGTPNTSSIMGSVRKLQLGSASGILSTTRSLSMAFGVGLSMALLNYYQNLFLRADSDIDLAFIYGFKMDFAFVAAVVLIGAIASLLRGKNLAEKTNVTS